MPGRSFDYCTQICKTISTAKVSVPEAREKSLAPRQISKAAFQVEVLGGGLILALRIARKPHLKLKGALWLPR